MPTETDYEMDVSQRMAYREGVDARKLGRRDQTNPYVKTHYLHRWWRQGWSDQNANIVAVERERK